MANTSPTFTITPQTTWGKVSGVDSSTDGTDADVVLVYTAGSSGAYIRRLICQPRSTSGSTTTSAAAIRVYLNNGSSVGTGTNNVLIREISVPAISVNTAATAAAIGTDIPLNMQLKASYKIYIGITAMAANTNWDITTDAADY